MAKNMWAIAKQVAIGLCVTAVAVASVVGLGALVKHKKNTAKSTNKPQNVYVESGKDGVIYIACPSVVERNGVFVEGCMRCDSSFPDNMITDKYKPLNAVVDFIKSLEGKDIIQIQQPISNVDEMIKALGNDFQVERVESVNRCCNKGVMCPGALGGPIKIFYDRHDEGYKESCLDYINEKVGVRRYYILLSKERGYGFEDEFSVILGTADVSSVRGFDVGEKTKLIRYQPENTGARILLCDKKLFQDDFFSECMSSIKMYLIEKVD